MIKDFEPILGEGFPSAVEIKSASGAFPDMGARTINLQCCFDGQTTPDFTKAWEFVYKGNKYIMPLRKPQGSKENTSLSGSLELPFQHWAEYQLQHKFFFEAYSVQAGTVIPSQFVAPVELNLKNFCILYSRVLEYWFGDKITLDIDQATIQNTTSEVQKVEISYAFMWEVLLKFHEIYGVHWQIEPNGDADHYVIKIRHGSQIELSHIFEYGFQGGLMKVERQVQNPDLRNIILGRGGEKNLPYRYFKNTDPNNTSFKADPDWIPELAQLPITQLYGATFRSYIRGWKAKHYGGTTTADDCYAPWAWQKGYTDEKFAPVEFVYDEESIAFYGELWGALDDNDEIYPSIQGRVRAGIGRIDEVVAVEPIISDDYVAKAEKESQEYSANLCGPITQILNPNQRATIRLVGGTFTIPEGLTGSLDPGAAAVEAWSTASVAGRRPTVDIRFPEADKYLVVDESVTVTVNGNQPASGLPSGTYSWSAAIQIHNSSNMTLAAKVQLPTPKVIASDINDEFTRTWCVWIKDVFNTPKPANKSPEAFAAEVWDPLLGDHLGNEAALFFTSGMLSTSEDYTFLLAKRPEYDPSMSIEVDGVGTVQSMWKLTLAKSDADLEATNLWLPSTMRQASAGDHFAFEGIELPHQYVLMAEEEIDNAKVAYLNKYKDIKPTWIVSLDKVRISRAQFDDVTAIIDQLVPGAAVRLHDPRFILNAQGTPAAYETLYITNVNIEWREPTSDSPALIPDVEITLSDKYEVAASTVSRMQSDIDALTRQVGSLGNIEQLIRAVGDKLYLRKDGIPDISMSPTQFFSLLTSGDFRNGMVGGAGWGFFRDANGNWVLETDRVNVRQEMQVNSLVINEVKGQGGMIVESAAVIEEVTDVITDDSGIYCYFDTKSGTLINQFRVDDVAYCSRYQPTSQADNTTDTFDTIKFYKRRVIEVGNNYIKLSKTEVNGSGLPEKGDAIIQYGNYTDAQRQYVKVRDVIGGGYERYLENLNSVNATGTEYYFVGRQAGMYNNRPRFYLGDANGYIEWIDGVLNIKGKLNTLSTIGDTNIGDYVNNAAQTAADAARAELQGKIDALQNQVDGVVEAWSYPYTPTASNYPADQWTTEGEKNAHVGDVFYNIQPAYNADGTANPDAGKAWRWSQGDAEHGNAYHWHPIADSDAVRALQLAQMSVTATDVLFKQHTSPTEPPALPVVNASGTITNYNGWATEAPGYEAGKFIWQTTYVKKGNGSVTFSDRTCISGRDGVGIDRIEEEYYLSTSRTALLGDTWHKENDKPTWVAGKYMWTRSHVYYTDGTDETFGEMCVTGESGANAPNLIIKYSATGGTAESEWHPNYAAGDIWMRTSNDGGVTWSAAVRIQGASYAPNLVLEGNVKFAATTTSYPIHLYTLDGDIELKAGDKLTITACFCVGDDDDKITFEIGNHSGTAFLVPTQKNVEEVKTIQVTLISVTHPKRFYAYASPYDQPPFSPNTYIKWIVVQRGYTEGVSEWTPAASEMVGQDGQWRKFQWAKNTSTTTAPTSGWQDAPMTANAGEYVWMRSGIVVPPATTPTTWETATRLTGDKGQSGDSVYMLDLSDEMMPMPCDAAGNVVGSYSTSQASVFKGGTKVTSGITYSIAQQTGVSATITSAGVVTPSNLTADRGAIVVQAVVAGVTLQTTLSLYKVKPGTDGANYSDNLYLNSAYEKGTAEWSFWRGYGMITKQNNSDNSDIMVVFASGGTNQIVSNKKIEVKAGEKFTLSGWIMGDTTGPLDYCYLLYTEGGNVAIPASAFITNNRVETDWKFFVVQFTAPRDGIASPGFGWNNSADPTLYLKQCKWERGYNNDPVWSPNSSEMVGEKGADAVVYQLELSANNVSRNTLGQLSATSITVEKYKTTGASARALTTEKKIRWQRIGVDAGYTEVQTGVSSTNIQVPDDPNLTAIVVELLDTDNKVLDRERVPLIQDGAELTENLVLNSEVNIAPTDSYKLGGKYVVYEDFVVGETYTFTIWGNLGSGRTFRIFDSYSSVHIGTLAKIAEGVYSAALTWKTVSTNAVPNMFTIFQYPSSAITTSSIKRIKVEKGVNLAPVWTQSPHEVDYLKKAMQEDGSMEGGLILASLMQMGFTNSSGTYKKMSGVSGIAENADDLAFWAGGEMIDPDKQPNASNLPKFGIRQNGTGFAADNTIRFKQNLIEIGKYINLDQDGLKMVINGYNRLVVGNESINGEYVLRARQRFSFTIGNNGASGARAYYYINGSYMRMYIDEAGSTGYINKTDIFYNGYARKGQELVFTNNSNPSGGLVPSSSIVVQSPYSNIGVTPGACPYLRMLVYDNGTYKEGWDINAASTLAGGNSLEYKLPKITLTHDYSNLGIEFRLLNSISLNANWSYNTISTKLAADNASGILYATLSSPESSVPDATLLGQNGLQFSWGNTHQYQQNGLWGVRVGNYGLMINNDGIFVMKDGENFKPLSI